MKYSCLLVLAVLIFLPTLGYGFGAHEGLNCTGCHGIHTAKADLIFSVEANKKSINSKTKQADTGTTALCLGCHESPDRGGMGILPVSAGMSHPWGVTPNVKVATIPSMLLRAGKLECVSCHDPHPSNPNYKYLRIDSANGSKMPIFCGMCHVSKVGSRPNTLNIFDSMDDKKGFMGVSAGQDGKPEPKAKPVEHKPAASPKKQQ